MTKRIAKLRTPEFSTYQFLSFNSDNFVRELYNELVMGGYKITAEYTAENAFLHVTREDQTFTLGHTDYLVITEKGELSVLTQKEFDKKFTFFE